MKKVLVAGSGGFIGGWLVKELLSKGYHVTAVDIKPLSNWYQISHSATNISADLSLLDNCIQVTAGTDEVYNLAADMGGMGYIENNKAACMLSVLINTHLLIAAKTHRIAKFFFSSSACVYNADKQNLALVKPLKEEDAYPAMPEDGYGWEKLFSERMCRHFYEDYGLETRVARYHNVYGPFGTWEGGREKAPAALSRKIAEAKLTKTNLVNIWGDGEQTRSFTYIKDAIDGTLKLMNSNFREPLNIGSSEMVSINNLTNMIAKIARISPDLNYDLSAPKGVRGRNSDNTKILNILNWQPNISLEMGLRETYQWIEQEVSKKIIKN